MKTYLTIIEKQLIVQRAYEGGESIRSVAKAHNVQPTQIRRWKKMLDNISSQIESGKKRNLVLANETLHAGRKPLDEDIHDDLRAAVDRLKDEGKPLKVSALVAECRRLKGMDNVSNSALAKRIHRWLRREQLIESPAVQEEKSIVDDITTI